MIIEQLSNQNQHLLDYCRNGYGFYVMPEKAMDLKKGEIPTGFVMKNENDHLIGRVVIAFEKELSFLVPDIEPQYAPSLYAVFVEENYRNLGIGQKLIEKALNYLQYETNAKYVCLDTNTAGKWYENKFNFQYSHQAIYENEYYNIYYKSLKYV